MMSGKVYTKQSLTDKGIACEAGLAKKIKDISDTLRENRFAEYPPYDEVSKKF